ncbi:MAG TPA: DUF2298 domain-containing protein [Candidatus Polarisedimenticolia bacterium]|nr:DUF2298 domain-containing protein [Candidatus Polarisedimenticolia bacterium]
MRLIYFLSLATIVYVNFLGLTLAGGRILPAGAIARAGAVIGVCAAAFFFEHFIGFGQVQWLLPPLTIASGFIVWRHRHDLLQRSTLVAEAAFVVAVGYGLCWKLAFPQIVESFDELSDVHLVANYMTGERLPPVDMWLPWQHLDYYYAFQHYAAGLFGRITGLGAGASFNVAAALLSGLVIALAWDFLESFSLRLPAKLLAIVCFAVGGTGLSPLFHLIAAPGGFFSAEAAHDAVLHNSRFIGWFEEKTASGLWRSLSPEPTVAGLQLPIETFGQQFPIGGFHAPLSGFLFLVLALAIIARLALRPTCKSQLEFLLGASVPLTICANAWVFPLQAILVGSWKLWDIGTAPLRELRFSITGFAAGLIAILPFLAGFAIHGHGISLVRVQPGQHSPWLQFLLLHWPLILAGLLAPFAGRQRGLALRFAAIFLPLLAATELLNAFDGAYGGDFVRFNPALKWWGWIFTGGFLALSTCLLASGRRLVCWVGAGSLILVSLFAVDLGSYFALRPKPYLGQLNGEGFYAADPANARLLAYLKNAANGLVLENVYDDSPKDTGIYGSLSGKPDLIGVPWILQVWDNRLTELPGLAANVGRFYRGQIPAALDFLGGFNVRYVVWSVRESTDLANWSAIDQAIEAHYAWMEFSATPDRHVGLWVRRP